MRVVSWNIRGGKHSGVVDSVIVLDPDVVVLVDCKAKHLDGIVADAAKGGFVHPLHNYPTYTGIVMVSKQPLTPGEIELDRAPKRWLHARSEHFDLDIAAVYGPLPKTIADEPTMTEYWNGLVGACDRLVDRRAVLCGDFNTGIDEADGPPGYRFRGAKPFSELKAHGWRDAYRELHPEGGQSWWRGERGFRIDHFMLSRAQHAASNAEYVQPLLGARPEVSHSGALKAPALPDHAALVVDL